MEKNILIVIGSLNIGGAEKHLTSYLPAIAKQGFNITVITLTDNNPLADFLRERSVKVVEPKNNIPKFVPFVRVIKIIKNILRISNELKNKDLVHFFLPESYILGMIAKFLVRFKGVTVMSRRSLNYYQKKRPIFRYIEKFLHKKVNSILVNSNAILKQLKEEGANVEKIKLIYNGVKLDKIYDKEKAKKEIKVYSPLILTIIANLIPYKGHKDLIHALNLIKHKLPKGWVLLCIGEDRGVLEELKNLSKDFNLENNIKWLGQIKQVTPFIQASDIGLLVSHEEGFSNAILEFMNQSVPVIATDVGGNKEAIEDCGIVVEKQNIHQIADAILKLQEEKLRKELGDKAKEKVTKYFDMDFCVEQYLNFYKTC